MASNAPRAARLEDTIRIRIDQLKVHPKNYLDHPDDEIDEIERSIKMHGFYRPVITARDYTMLAGHGVTQTLLRMGYEYVDVIVKDYDPESPEALALLCGDNEMGRLAERNDRQLTENLKFIKEKTADLGGTGYDEMRLAGLKFVTSTAQEIQDRDAAADWSGMPEYAESSQRLKCVVFFPTEDDRQEFGRRLGVDMDKVGLTGLKQVLWWPHRIINDLKSLVFTDQEELPMTVTETVEQAEVPVDWNLEEAGFDPIEDAEEAAALNMVRPDFSGKPEVVAEKYAPRPTVDLDGDEG